MHLSSSILYVVATPIGNLDDITTRAIKILSEVDLIAAEDTRTSAILLKHYEITTPTTSYHEHNENTKTTVLISKLKDGAHIALISDGGLPCISDPGYLLVRACRVHDIEITVLPGASAGISALVLSGLPAHRYVFEGFLPQKAARRNEMLAKLAADERTIILYEAPHRLTDTLQYLIKSLGNRQAAAIREITKKFEEVRRGSLEQLLEFYTNNLPRGEFVLVVEGQTESPCVALPVAEHVKKYIDEGMEEKEAIKRAAKERGLPKREVYQEYKLHRD